MKTRRTFSRDYKLEAFKKVVLQGMSFCEVARDLGIRDKLIHNWKKKFQDDGTLAELTGGASAEEELKRLREEVRQLTLERDILKKATAFFAKESR